MGDKTTALIFLVKDQASGAVKGLENSLNSLSNKADLGGRALHGFQSILSGIGMGIGFAAFSNLESLFSRLTAAIPELVTKGLTFADTVHQITLVTGASAEQASRLVGIFGYLGISTEGLAQKFGLIAKNAVLHADALRRVGIDIGSANTGFDNQVTILDKLRSALNDVSGGTARQAVLQTVLGRNAATLAEYFSLTNGQVKLLSAEMDKLGITMDEQGVAKAEATSKEFNLFGLSVQGVANRLLNDVAPALQAAVSGLADFVARNGKAIAQFASDVVNFVFGMIDALTGANLAAAPFTSQMQALTGATTGAGTSLDGFGAKTTKAAGATAASTKAIDAKIAALKAEDAASDKLYTREIAGLTKTLDLEIKSLDASMKARQSKESQLALAQQFVDAEQALAEARAGTGGVVDPVAVTAAYKQVADIVQRQGDAQAQAAVDARKAEIDGVKSYVTAIEQALKDSTNKKALIHQLDKDAATLASQQATAKQAGDLQLVADLQVEIDAVRTTKARAQDAARTTSAEDALNRQKAALASVGAATVNLGTTVGAVSNVMTNDMRHFGGALNGVGGLVGAFSDAKKAGADFGASIKKVLGEVGDLLRLAVGAVDGLSKALSAIPALGTQERFAIGLAIAGFGATRLSPSLVIAGLGIAGIALSEGGTGPGGLPDNFMNPFGGKPSGDAQHPGPPLGPPLPPKGVTQSYTPSSQPLHIQVLLDGHQIKDYIDTGFYGPSVLNRGT